MTVLLCRNCGDPIFEPGPSGRPRTKFCSTRCSLRFHGRKGRARQNARNRELRAARNAVKEAAETFLRIEYPRWSDRVERVVGVEIRYVGWGSNDSRPYGRYEWVKRL